MKKFLLSVFVLAALNFAASAQIEKKSNGKKAKVETPHHEVKVKKTSSPSQKVHNVIHPKKKQYNGVKVKHEAKKD
ncbi:MAG: hypothetical protein ACJ75B_02700 [Flavisolibacter sp.]